jgi:tryptophanyl-tRNA synthetase
MAAHVTIHLAGDARRRNTPSRTDPDVSADHDWAGSCGDDMPHGSVQSDPGKIEGNVVFTDLDVFDEDRAAVEAMKAHYRQGGLGDMDVKGRLDRVLQSLLAPIRERRAAFARNPGYVLSVLE